MTVYPQLLDMSLRSEAHFRMVRALRQLLHRGPIDIEIMKCSLHIAEQFFTDLGRDVRHLVISNATQIRADRFAFDFSGQERYVIELTFDADMRLTARQI